MSSVGFFFSYVNDARSHEPKVFFLEASKPFYPLLPCAYPLQTQFLMRLTCPWCWGWNGNCCLGWRIFALKAFTTVWSVKAVNMREVKYYTGCPRRNVPNFRRVFLMLNYTNITQNTYIQSWTVREIMAREVWNFDSCYTLTDCQIHIETGRNMWFL